MSAPFTGTWIFNPRRSSLDVPAPQRWVQQMTINGDSMTSVAARFGAVVLKEPASAAADGSSLTLRFSISNGAREIAGGTAVFERLA